MLYRCIVGGCFNIRKDGVSFYKWFEDVYFVKLWINVVKNTRFDVFNFTISRFCSVYFIVDFFEE